MRLKYFLFAGILVTLLCQISAWAESLDPLFSQMDGHWVGQGSRHYLISGRQIEVSAEVTTSYQLVRGVTALLSQNQITETSNGSPPKTYQTIYWVRPADVQTDGQPRQYELGGQGSTQPSSHGILGLDGVFRVEQDLGGGDQPYVIRSETQFYSEQTIYTDVFTQGTEIQSQTRIEYHR